MQRRKFLVASLSALPAAVAARTGFAIRVRSIKPFQVKAGEARFGKRYHMKGVTSNTLDIKISGKDTDGALAVFEQTGQTPYGGPPLHLHPDQDEWFFVTEGAYRFVCGGEIFHLQAGDTIFLPRRVPHAFIQLTERARTIVSYQPAGKMEEFFAATDRWTAPPSREEVARVFAAHGMKVVGAPLQPE